RSAAANCLGVDVRCRRPAQSIECKSCRIPCHQKAYFMTITRRAVLLAALPLAAGSAAAAPINIVALGASNTYGKGVARGQDYPAQLQAMLRAKGLYAHVANAGINGDTTGGMLARLGSAVPAGTQIVILQPGGNDRRKGQSGRESNIGSITSQLAARKIKVIMLDRVLGSMAQHLQPDGRHLTPEGHRIIPALLL